MWRKRAESSGGVARLNPGRKASATRKCRRPRGDTDGGIGNPKRGDMRRYMIQRDHERGINAVYPRATGMDLFHLGALGRLMRCVLSLSLSLSLRPSVCVVEVAADAALPLACSSSRPQDHGRMSQSPSRQRRSRCCASSTLRCACGHTNVWRLSNTRVVRPLHVRRALELCGGVGVSRLW